MSFFSRLPKPKQNMNCFAEAFARLMAHHDDSENLLLISRELDTCLQQKEKRRIAMQELDARVDALVQWRQDTDASASRALHLGPTGPLFHDKPNPRRQDPDANAGMVHH